jgi:hypothetical protein
VTGILFACPRMEWCGEGSIDYFLIYDGDVLKDGLEAQAYAYDFSEQAEVMGFPVTENRFTQSGIYGLMADVLYEASFFGFREEYRDEALGVFGQTIRNIDKTKAITPDEFGKLFQSESCIVPGKEYLEEKALRVEAEKAILKYNVYCRNREVKEIIRLSTTDNGV